MASIPLFIGPESKFPIFKLNSMLYFMSKNGKNCRTIPFTILLFLSTFSKRQKLRIPALWKLLYILPVMLLFRCEMVCLYGVNAEVVVLLRNMLAACCDGILTIGLKNIIESCLQIENPYIKQRRIANPPRRREHPPQRV